MLSAKEAVGRHHRPPPGRHLPRCRRDVGRHSQDRQEDRSRRTRPPLSGSSGAETTRASARWSGTRSPRPEARSAPSGCCRRLARAATPADRNFRRLVAQERGKYRQRQAIARSRRPGERLRPSESWPETVLWKVRKAVEPSARTAPSRCSASLARNSARRAASVPAPLVTEVYAHAVRFRDLRNYDLHPAGTFSRQRSTRSPRPAARCCSWTLTATSASSQPWPPPPRPANRSRRADVGAVARRSRP